MPCIPRAWLYPAEMEDVSPPSPGWIGKLSGHEFDLADWQLVLKAPFDPTCERISHTESVIWVLRSRSFDNLQTPDEVRLRALALIERLNGALQVECRGEPLVFDGVGRIDEAGQIQLFQFAEAHIRGRSRLSAVGQVLNPNGNIVPPPSPDPSQAQRWLEAAESDDEIADMLTFAGRSDNWFDIYKALELAKRLAGDENGPGNNKYAMKALLGTEAYKKFDHVWQTANTTRHARYANEPGVLATLNEAKAILSHVVKAVLDTRKP
jgi:hypothetical protein